MRGGRPPEGHARQCQAKLKKHNYKRCGKWALTDRNYCAFHGGRRPTKHRVRIDHLPRFYSNQLKSTLQDYVESCLDADPTEQIQLFEELALMRHSAQQVVTLYSASLDSTSIEAQTVAAELMRDVLRQVSGMCKDAAAVSASTRDKVSVHSLQYVVHQIVRLIYDTIEEADAKKLEEVIRKQIRVTDTSEGTTSTPDALTLEMDGTIPCS